MSADLYAAYESRCGICDGLIQEGDPIANVDDEWCHARCAEDGGAA